jgi:hypothetical protein
MSELAMTGQRELALSAFEYRRSLDAIAADQMDDAWDHLADAVRLFFDWEVERSLRYNPLGIVPHWKPSRVMQRLRSQSGADMTREFVTEAYQGVVGHACRVIICPAYTEVRLRKEGQEDAENAGQPHIDDKSWYQQRLRTGERAHKSEQEHAGAAGSGDPAVEYGYEISGAGNAKNFRADSVTYPNGHEMRDSHEWRL